MPTGIIANPALAQQLLDALDALSGLHPGFRPAHAKGLMCAGLFTPSPEAAHLTRAPHASRPSTPVTVRYSNSTGVPTIPDNDPARSGPRGIAVRFHLAEHAHTDIVGHSTNGFPVRTGEEFVEFLRAAAAAGARSGGCQGQRAGDSRAGGVSRLDAGGARGGIRPRAAVEVQNPARGADCVDVRRGRSPHAVQCASTWLGHRRANGRRGTPDDRRIADDPR
jgi:hypothetical protein